MVYRPSGRYIVIGRREYNVPLFSFGIGAGSRSEVSPEPTKHPSPISLRPAETLTLCSSAAPLNAYRAMLVTVSGTQYVSEAVEQRNNALISLFNAVFDTRVSGSCYWDYKLR